MVSCLRKNLLVKNTHLTQKIEENLGQSQMQRPKHENPKKNKAKQRGIKNILAREGQKNKRKTAHA